VIIPFHAVTLKGQQQLKLDGQGYSNLREQLQITSVKVTIQFQLF
jgi:hypothetical protein